MTPQIPSPEILRIGYSARTKAAVAAAACAGWLFTWSILTGGTSAIVLLPATVAIICTGLWIVTLRSCFTIDEARLQHRTWRGRTEFRRSDFLAAESVEERGKTALFLRFQSGVAMLSDARGCSDPDAIRMFLERHWEPVPGTKRRNPVGPVADTIELEYEPLQPALLAFATVALAALSSLGPMFWAAAVFAFLTGRAFYFVSTCRHIATGPEGITITRPFQPKLSIPWNRVSSVRYWHSLAHGGMILSDGRNTIRIYRWIKNYPRFNRLVQDHVAATSFPAPHTLPWNVALNRRRQSGMLVLLVTTGASLWLAEQGAWPAGLLLFAVPAITFVFTVLSSDHRIEIGHDRITLREKKGFVRSTHEYRRQDLEDMRLGRQLTAGGLWLNFGAQRLEIANLDSQCPPEEIQAVLRREWHTDPPSTAPPTEFRAA